MAVEPLVGKRTVVITETRTRIDWAHFIKHLVDDVYINATKIVLVVDNLNTHDLGSLYYTFPAEEASRISNRLDIHFTPKHGSWLNIAEIELSALKSQCLNRRIPDINQLRKEVKAWETSRNNSNAIINWQFTCEDARIKLRHIYPKFN
jgi:hypothetical protein